MNERLVIRGGYGIFNMALHLDNINTLGTNPPTASVQVTNPTLNPLATLANPFPAALVPTNTIFNVTSAEVDRNHQDGYYQNWNVAVGYELSRSASVEVRYVGAKGSNLDTSLTNFNSPDPDPAAGTANLQARRPYPAFGRIRMWATDGESDYQSLQTEYQQRAMWGLTMTAAYTLSELNDNQQGGLNASRARRQNPRSLEGEYAPSADDQRHRLVVGFSWDVPFGANLTGFTGQLVKGWQIAALGIFNSGSPLFINQDGDTLNVDSEEVRPNLVSGQDPTLLGRRADDRALVQHRRVRARDHDLRHVVAQSAGRPGPQGRRRLDLEGVQAADGTPDQLPGGGLQRLQLGELEQSRRHARHDELRRDQRRRRGARDAVVAALLVLAALLHRGGGWTARLRRVDAHSSPPAPAVSHPCTSQRMSASITEGTCAESRGSSIWMARPPTAACSRR